MGLIDNSPTTKWIRWRDLLVTYEGNTYQIQNSETNLKYVYWDVTNPYTLQCFNRTKNQKPGFYQLFINERGMGTERSHEDLIISWDGNNSDLIMKQIFGLHEENKQTGNKFVAMETDINGIRNTVGKTQQSVDELKENVTKIEQKADKIDLSVKELNQEFTDNREVNELRENLNKSMIDFNSSLGIFKSEIYTYYKDNKIDEEEKIKINTHLDIMDSKRAEVVKYVDVVINIMQSKDQTTEVNRLNSAKTKFINSVSNLRTYITNAISDNTIVPSEMTGITDLFAKCNIAINELKNTCDDCIFLGAGGKITEELAQISMKSDEILFSVSKNEEDIRNNLSIEKNLLQGNITDFRNVIDRIIKNLKDSFKDGKVSNAELEIINLRINEITKEKNDIDKKYNDTYSNQHISQSMKSKLKIEYDKFNNKFTEMINKINEVISDEFVNEAEQAQVETVINEMLSSIVGLHTLMCQSMDDIQLNANRAEIKAAKDELQGNINDVNDKVGDLNDYINGTFEDNILDETERKAIKGNLDNLQREKVDIENQYNQLNGNEFLDGILKTNYTTSYNNFLSKYNSLVDLMNGILNKSELINNSDRDNMNKGYAQLNEALGTFVRLSNEVIEYIAKKEAEHVKNALNQGIIDVDNKINDLNNKINDTFKNNVIDESERKAISLNLKDLESQKIDIDNQYNQFILSTFLDGTLKIEFENKYNDLVSKYNSLIKVMNDILSKKELINDTDRNNMNSARDLFNLSIGEFSRVANRVIEYIGKKQSESAVGDFSKQLEDLNDKVDGILDDVGGAIADDIIDETERIAIKQSLKELEKEFIENEVEYQKIYNNVNLVGDIKTQLNTAYNTYVSKYNNLIDAINFLLNKVGLIDDLDRKNLDNAYMEYGTAIRLYLSKLYEAMDSITNKGINDAKNEMNKELEDLSSSLSELEETMNGVFKDGVLSDAEKLAIKQNIKTLEIEKADIDKSYSTVYNNKNLIGTPKSDLKNSYDLYVLEHNNLIKTINDILSKTGLVDNTDQAKLDTAFSKHKISLSEFKVKYNVAIDSITNKSISDAKDLLQNEINDLNNALGDLEHTMNNAFKDGVLSDAEKLAIKQNLQTISNEKVDVDKQYNSVYENPDLIGNAKTNLKISYDTYVNKYNALVVIVNDILNKIGLVDSTDQNKLDNGFNDYRLSSGEYSKRVNEAIDSIAKKKADDAEKNAKTHTEAQIKIINDAINLKVSQTEYDNNNKEISNKFSEIRQTTEGISNSVNEIKGDYAKKSELNQTKGEIEMKFSEVGGTNEIRNSKCLISTDFMYTGGHSGSPIVTLYQGHPNIQFTVKNYGASGGFQTASIPVVEGEKHTLAFDYTFERGMENYVEIHYYSTEHTGFGAWPDVKKEIPYDKSLEDKGSLSYTTTVPEGAKWMKFYIYTAYNGVNSSQYPYAHAYINELRCFRSSSAGAWQPHQEELYLTDIKFDKNGISIHNKDGYKALMSGEGIDYLAKNGKKRMALTSGSVATYNKLDGNYLGGWGAVACGQIFGNAFMASRHNAFIDFSHNVNHLFDTEIVSKGDSYFKINFFDYNYDGTNVSPFDEIKGVHVNKVPLRVNNNLYVSNNLHVTQDMEIWGDIQAQKNLRVKRITCDSGIDMKGMSVENVYATKYGYGDGCIVKGDGNLLELGGQPVSGGGTRIGVSDSNGNVSDTIWISASNFVWNKADWNFGGRNIYEVNVYKSYDLNSEEAEILINTPYSNINEEENKLNVDTAKACVELTKENIRLKEEQSTQDLEIMTNMLANTEIFELILTMLPVESSVKKYNNDSKNIIEVYATLIMKGVKTLDEVPVILRPQVEERLKQLGVYTL